jgi:hypothetical protein
MYISIPNMTVSIRYYGPSWYRKKWKWFYSYQPMFQRMNVFGIEINWRD